jgi:hypothetical protein
MSDLAEDDLLWQRVLYLAKAVPFVTESILSLFWFWLDSMVPAQVSNLRVPQNDSRFFITSANARLG